MAYLIKVRIKRDGEDWEKSLDNFFKLGFTRKTELEDSETVILQLPNGWTIREVEETQEFFDANGNLRGACCCEYCYLRQRYELISEKMVNKLEERLIALDRKNQKKVVDFGTFEPFSDYHKDLMSFAKYELDKRFPGWTDPTKYWD